MGTKPLEFHDLSIFNASQTRGIKQEKPITSLKYVPPTHIDALRSNGKNAIKIEVMLFYIITYLFAIDNHMYPTIYFEKCARSCKVNHHRLSTSLNIYIYI